VIHHIQDVPAALHQISRAIAPGGKFVLEFANKHNIKSLARYALRRQKWNPNQPEPYEFIKLNFDFHPTWMLEQLRQAGLKTERALAVSYLRSGLFKRHVPVNLMVYTDALLQLTAPLGLLSPSVFTLNSRAPAKPAAADGQAVPGDDIFRCPRTGQKLRRDGDTMVNEDGLSWQVHGAFYDFKEPV
jgi:hypothetical protein